MAGHSKWKNIQHRKSGQDAKRGKIFTKLIREILTAARIGGEDLNSNPRLRTAVDKALTQNMTKDTITRAIKRGLGGEDGSQLEEIRYEGYGPNGVAVMVDSLTDNKNRTVADIRYAFSRCGGNLSTTGSVAYLFNQQGLINFDAGIDEETVMNAAIEAGAHDVIVNDDGSIDILTAPDHFSLVCNALQANKLNIKNAEITWLPTTEITLNTEQSQDMLKLIEILEDLDDVQHVFSNADIPADVLEKL